jgi:hypothetical protein
MSLFYVFLHVCHRGLATHDVANIQIIIDKWFFFFSQLASLLFHWGAWRRSDCLLGCVWDVAGKLIL